MLKALLSIINVEEGEERPALLMLGYGFFMGVFLATYKVVAETLFLKTMSEDLQEAFFISGLLGVISAWLYSYLQHKIGFAKLVVFNLFAIFGFIGYLYLNITLTANPRLIFILYVMLFPITSIMLLSFWGMFGRIFDLRQSKRIIGGIDAGQLIATIIAFLTVPLLINFLGDVSRILIISTFSLVFCLFFLIFIVRWFRADIVQQQKSDEKEVRVTLIKLFKYKYAVYLSLFIAVSIITFSIVDYIFLTITEQQYPDENSLANFLSYMYLAIFVFTLFMQTFVNDKLIATYGLKTALTILPIVLGIFAVGALLTGTFFGYDLSSPTFIWFFLFVVLSKFFSHSIREALEIPTFKLFFMPLSVNIRFDIQAKIEGVINEFSRLIAGGIILLLGFFTFFEILHYNYFLIFVILGYFLVTGRLYNQYRTNVKNRLQNIDELTETIEAEEEELESILNTAYNVADPSQLIFTYKLVEKLDYNLVRESLNPLIVHPDRQIKKFGLEKMNEQRRISGVLNPNRTIDLSDKGSNGKDGLDKWLNRLKYATETNPEVESVSLLSRSENIDDRIQAANLISINPVDEVIPYLIDLLNDIDYKVRLAAIRVSGSINKPEFYPFLIDNLSSFAYGDQTAYALANQGDDILQNLEVAFHKTGQDQTTQVRIIKIYEKIGTEKALELLWSKVDYPDKKAVTQVLMSLANSDFLAEGYQTVQIKYVIESDINNLVWNLNALDKIPSSKTNSLIADAIHEENQYNYNHIYMLLSMIFDRNSIQLIKENIESKTNEGVSYAIELLDVLLSEDIKDRIIPLLDDIHDQEKVRRLNVFYPHLITDFHEVIKHIINKEFNQINRWTKILSLYYVGKEKIQGYNLELISNLFNPDRQLSETSAWSLYQIDKDIYEENIKRLSTDLQDEYNSVIVGFNVRIKDSFQKSTAIEKIFFLKKTKLFANMPGNLITSIVDYLEEVFCYEGSEIILDHDNIKYFYIIYEGIINIMQHGIVNDSLEKYEYQGEMTEEKREEDFVSIVPITNAVLFRIDKDRFYEVLSADHDLAKRFIANMSKSIEISDEFLEITA